MENFAISFLKDGFSIYLFLGERELNLIELIVQGLMLAASEENWDSMLCIFICMW